jgi:hypothetical protein
LLLDLLVERQNPGLVEMRTLRTGRLSLSHSRPLFHNALAAKGALHGRVYPGCRRQLNLNRPPVKEISRLSLNDIPNKCLSVLYVLQYAIFERNTHTLAVGPP